MNRHKGGSLDAFLEEEGCLDEVSAKARKRLLALQLSDIMKQEHLTKTHLARALNTSRSQVDRLLDPENTTITLESLDRLAHAVGRQLRIEFA
ncbi:MAG: XRE family transcriptional regulator [Magnetococcales bacterium]|nr:XRE family transcriptional regulator [Magnetococcales bacterium]MBF0420849.1 XRE family transcriptional regulator [Magnetococcales bacterium]